MSYHNKLQITLLLRRLLYSSRPQSRSAVPVPPNIHTEDYGEMRPNDTADDDKLMRGFFKNGEKILRENTHFYRAFLYLAVCCVYL